MPTPAGAVAANAEAVQGDAAKDESHAVSRETSGGFFGRKYGPLKGWQWSLAAGGLAIAYFWWRSRAKATAATTGTGTGTGTGSEIDALQDEIDQLHGSSAGTAAGGGITGILEPGTGSAHSPAPGHRKPEAPESPQIKTVNMYSATVTWDRPHEAGPTRAAFQVNRSGAGTETTPGTTHTFTGLKPGTHYTWRVRSIGPGGASDWAGGSFTTKPAKRK